MKAKSIFLIMVGVLAFTIGCGNTLAKKGRTVRATDFELKTIDDQTIRLSDYSGKVILLNFFATWCPPCLMEMPAFNEMSMEYKGALEVIAVNVGREPLSKVREFALANNLQFTIAMDDGKVSKLYGPIRGIPVTVIIDKDFNIAKKYIGARPKAVFVKDIEKLL